MTLDEMNRLRARAAEGDRICAAALESITIAQTALGALADAGERLKISRAGWEAVAAMEQIHKAFGAPGDYGYNTKEGKALYRLYQAHGPLAGALEPDEPGEATTTTPAAPAPGGS